MNRSPEENIALYGSLSSREQADVDAYVQAHPALRPLLEDAKRLHVLAAHVAPRVSVEDDDLAEALLAEYLGPRSEAERALVTRTRTALEEDEALRAVYDRMLARLREIVQAAAPPAAQFEALTGHRLDTPLRPPAPSAPQPYERPRAADRPAARPDRTPRRLPVRRWALAATLAAAALYVGLYASGPLLAPAYQQEANLDQLTGALSILQAGVRSATPDDAAVAAREEVEAAYAGALADLADARSTRPLGLFPYYDQRRLDEVAATLRDVAARVEVAPDLALDAEFTVGAIRLYQDRRSEACAAFERVVREEGPRQTRAEALIDAFCEG